MGCWASLVPRPLPDFILQLWRKLGSGLGTRLMLGSVLPASELNPHMIDSHSVGDGRQTMSEEMIGVDSCLPIVREVVSADPPQP